MTHYICAWCSQSPTVVRPSSVRPSVRFVVRPSSSASSYVRPSVAVVRRPRCPSPSPSSSVRPSPPSVVVRPAVVVRLSSASVPVVVCPSVHRRRRPSVRRRPSSPVRPCRHTPQRFQAIALASLIQTVECTALNLSGTIFDIP